MPDERLDTHAVPTHAVSTHAIRLYGTSGCSEIPVRRWRQQCVRADPDMPVGLRQFAQYQPFTPVADSVRELLTGAPAGGHALAAVAWSIGIAALAYLWPSASTTGSEQRNLRDGRSTPAFGSSRPATFGGSTRKPAIHTG